LGRASRADRRARQHGVPVPVLRLGGAALVRDLGIGYADVGFLIGLYMLPGIVLSLPGGLLGRRFGDKRMVVVGLGLMVFGGVLTGFAESYAMLLAGRLLSGIGGVLLNVLMSKMVTDWFAGSEIVLAMTIFVNSFPVGIGLALLSLRWLSEHAGWAAAFHASTAAAVAALLLVALLYRPHESDGRSSAGGGPGSRISRREIALVCMLGAIWGIFNGAFTIMISFTPIRLIASGLSIGKAGLIAGAVTWMVVASVQAGGIVAHRWGYQNLLMLGGIAAWGIGLLLVPSVEPLPPLLVIGVVSGLPVGVIMSLPAEVLRPESRAAGMGLFYTFLYIGHTGLPPLAGRIQDAIGGTAASLYFAAALVFAIIPIFAVFRVAQHGKFSGHDT
jgi:predicted MFS family arabinose efflux permease